MSRVWTAKPASGLPGSPSPVAAQGIRRPEALQAAPTHVDVGKEAPRVAVVGTGIAALLCTRTLARMARSSKSSLRGARVTLCTSRGKLATQMGPRNQTEPAPGKPFFDYGCQYFTASDPWFAEEVQRWSSGGACQPLPVGAVGTLSVTEGFVPLKEGSCWVGNGGMGPMLSRLIAQTAEEFQDTVEHVSGFPNESMKVVALRRLATEGCWELTTKGGQRLGPFDFVIGGFAQHVLTDPFLLTGAEACEKMLRCLRRVESNQIIPIQVAFEGEPLPMPFTAAHVYGEEALSFVSDNSQKPQQNGKLGTPGPQHVTLLSTARFAEQEFNTNPKGYRRVAEEQMFAALCRVLGIQGLARHQPKVNRINHWEDGLAANTPPESQGCLFDKEVGLGWCGDFCVAPGLQGAALSGRAMAETLEAWMALQTGGSSFNDRGLLPSDEPWSPIGTGLSGQGVSIVDIGGFAQVPPNSTHTDLVPSAIGGYNKESAHYGAAGAGKSRGKSDGKGGGRSKGKGCKGYGRGKA